MGSSFSSVVEAWRWTGAAEDQNPGAAPDKTSWPELVGSNIFDAAHDILEDRHEVSVHHYRYCENAPPPGFDPKRVVVFGDSNFRVATVPKLG
ncbi:unnamed protein product [Alopecurus aequalis]